MEIKEKTNKIVLYIVIGLLSIGIIGLFVKILQDTPDYNPYILEQSRLKSELFAAKNKSIQDSLEVLKWTKLYEEANKKPKIIIKKVYEKVDSIRSLSLDSSAKYFSEWSKLAPPGIPE